MDGGGFGTEDGLFPARALVMVLAGHIQRQTRCLEMIAECAALDHKTKLEAW